jgi:hypothetical protein
MYQYSNVNKTFLVFSDILSVRVRPIIVLVACKGDLRGTIMELLKAILTPVLAI